MAKYIISAFLAACLVVFINGGEIAPEFHEIAPEVRSTCVEETGVDVDLIERASNGDFADDPKLKCYLKCSFAQLGAVSDTGVKFDVLMKLAPPSYEEKIQASVDACKDIKATTPGDICDEVYEVNKCIQKIMPKEYFII